eukprot:scaffold22086_cov71-Cyclotella_meneghiniana.AAC.7
MAHKVEMSLIHLPGDILQESVLPLLDLHSLVKFSTCSAQCGKIVFNDSPVERWGEIRFCDGVTPCTINDRQLRAFLCKINAKENTHTISLIGCPNVKGTGLEPLRRSQVLQDIDMRNIGTLPYKGEQGAQYGPSSLRHIHVFNILYSILEEMRLSRRNVMVLRRLAFRLHLDPANTNPTIKALFEQRESLWSRWNPSRRRQTSSLSDDVTYFFCMGPRCEINPKPDIQYPVQSCFTCKSQYCHDCAPQLMECSVCDHKYCNDCAMPPTCLECTANKCQWCANITQCSGCKKQCCASHGFESCGKCNKDFCLDCTEDGELLFCVVCNMHYCGDECHKGVHNT